MSTIQFGLIMGLRHNVLILTLVIGATWAANPKSFSIFNVVQFKNEACVSTSTTMGSGNRNGTCFTSEGTYNPFWEKILAF